MSVVVLDLPSDSQSSDSLVYLLDDAPDQAVYGSNDSHCTNGKGEIYRKVYEQLYLLVRELQAASLLSELCSCGTIATAPHEVENQP